MNQLEKEFVSVIDSITKETIDQVLSKTIIKTLDNLQKQVKKTSDSFKKENDEMKKNRDTQAKDIKKFRDEYEKLSTQHLEDIKLVITRMQEAEKQYEDNTKLINADLTKEHEVIKNAQSSINNTINTLSGYIDTWEKNIKEYSKRVEELDERVNNFETNVKKILDDNYKAEVTEIVGSRKALNEEISSKFTTLMQTYQSSREAQEVVNNCFENLIKNTNNNIVTVNENLMAYRQKYSNNFEIISDKIDTLQKNEQKMSTIQKIIFGIVGINMVAIIYFLVSLK